MCSGSTHERETLQYCVDVLDRRQRKDPMRAWLWKIKKKVARYQIGLKAPSDSTTERPLSDPDKTAIRLGHPLLQDTKIRSHKRLDRHDGSWFASVRERVRRAFHRE